MSETTAPVGGDAPAPPAESPPAPARAEAAEGASLPALLPSVAHVALDLLVAVVPFTVVVVLLALSLSLMVLFLLGVPLLLLTFAASRAFARMQRGRIEAVLGVRIPAPSPPRRGGGLVERARAEIRSGTQWRQLSYHLLALPFAVVTSVLAFGVPGCGLALATVLGWSARMDRSQLAVLRDGWTLPAWTFLGVMVLFLAPWGVRAAAAGDVWLARTLLGRDERAELAARVDTLTETRAGVVAAADAERQRIERDLHDGAQQRLVSLAMSLGRAQNRLETDPEGARELLAEAHREAKLAMTEIRDLARGIHPSILTDRGLAAALAPVAARLPLPVHLDISVDPRPAPDVEAVAYYTVVEALTNVAKHADAREASVLARRVGDTLLLEVRDDGRGGADTARGSGLRGLAGRLAGVDGTFSVTSPPGGPTVVRAELPAPAEGAQA
ncbi:signal transduction histidine kinase [Motilibacter peucedani]|uniref:histidine kinase n=1 Tax=Motilibacter peucedani TaxID=598650 RepID=A0A420XML2_9ACTN|nr:sensor domain-containing protein [Motilibacter peucedani]RKS72513.1 signal transduction histidine kinase [Motilibacter peucedani]